MKQKSKKIFGLPLIVVTLIASITGVVFGAWLLYWSHDMTTTVEVFGADGIAIDVSVHTNYHNLIEVSTLPTNPDVRDHALIVAIQSKYLDPTKELMLRITATGPEGMTGSAEMAWACVTWLGDYWYLHDEVNFEIVYFVDVNNPDGWRAKPTTLSLMSVNINCDIADDYSFLITPVAFMDYDDTYPVPPPTPVDRANGIYIWCSFDTSLCDRSNFGAIPITVTVELGENTA